MPQTKSRKPLLTQSEAKLLGEATHRLLKAVKEHAKAKGTPIRREELLRQGYGKRFVAKFEAA
jgi:hypothetical protein